MRWSPQQADALVAVDSWLKSGNSQVFRLFGFAGTGKSTLAKHLAEGVGTVCFAAFTGKAALVMRRRGCSGASTIHSLIYKPEEDENGFPIGNGAFVLDPNSPARTADLIVIDEVSMVDEQLAMDLLSFGAKVLVLGDPFQLPPVKGTGFFTLREPDIMLTEIHRQAADSPIIRMSIDIREGRGLSIGQYGTSKVIARPDVIQAEVMAADQVIVGLNKSRIGFNTRMRQLLGRTKETPEVDDKVVCLRNNRAARVLNGQLFKVQKALATRTGKITMDVIPDDEPRKPVPRNVTTHLKFFTGDEADFSWQARKKYQEFTYGYALTCHKSQGSQWDSVYLFNEGFGPRDERARWLYTAVTRAADRVTVVL